MIDRVTKEVKTSMTKQVKIELNDKSHKLSRDTSCCLRVMNIWELEKITIKRILRTNNTGRLESDKRLYLSTKYSGRGLKRCRDIYDATKVYGLQVP